MCLPLPPCLLVKSSSRHPHVFDVNFVSWTLLLSWFFSCFFGSVCFHWADLLVLICACLNFHEPFAFWFLLLCIWAHPLACLPPCLTCVTGKFQQKVVWRGKGEGEAKESPPHCTPFLSLMFHWCAFRPSSARFRFNGDRCKGRRNRFLI